MKFEVPDGNEDRMRIHLSPSEMLILGKAIMLLFERQPDFVVFEPERADGLADFVDQAIAADTHGSETMLTIVISELPFLATQLRVYGKHDPENQIEVAEMVQWMDVEVKAQSTLFFIPPTLAPDFQ